MFHTQHVSQIHIHVSRAAGDNVKFGFPMAASTTLLAWGFIRFHDGYTSAGKVGQMYDSLKWPLDYFLKAWNPGSRKLVVQVTQKLHVKRRFDVRLLKASKLVPTNL